MLFLDSIYITCIKTTISESIWYTTCFENTSEVWDIFWYSFRRRISSDWTIHKRDNPHTKNSKYWTANANTKLSHTRTSKSNMYNVYNISNICKICARVPCIYTCILYVDKFTRSTNPFGGELYIRWNFVFAYYVYKRYIHI